MKKITFIFIAFLIVCSCFSQVKMGSWICIYRNVVPPNIRTTFLIINRQPNTYELHVTGEESVFGHWHLSNDTLFLNPYWEHTCLNNYCDCVSVFSMDADTTISTIPQQFILRNDTLFDITDYSIVFTGDLAPYAEQWKTSGDELIRVEGSPKIESWSKKK